MNNLQNYPAHSPVIGLINQKSTILRSLLPITMAAVCTLGLSNQSFAQEDRVAQPTHPNAIQFNVEESGGEVTYPMIANFVEVGKPTGGYKSICDMTVFNGKLFLATSNDPLGNWGTNVFSTTGSTFTKVLEDNSSQGYLRMRVYDNQLWIPDGDPNGMDPSYVYISPSGNASSFTKTTILSAVHSFDVVKYLGKFYVANGMSTYQGGLCMFNGTSTWNSVYQSGSTFRMKYMAESNGKLFVANRNDNSDVDYLLWSGDVASSSPVLKNAVTGSAGTYQIFASSQGKFFWTVVYSSAIHVLQSTDGLNWTPSPSLDGKFVSDFVEYNGNLYALEWGGLWESTDHTNFTKIASVPTGTPDIFGPVAVQGGYSADAKASIEAFNGSLYCGSSTNGKVYKVDVATSVNENPNQAASFASVQPNPFASFTNIQLTKPVQNARLTVFSALGQEVRVIDNIAGSSFTFYRDNLPSGIYYVKLSENNAIIATDKMVIVD